MRNLLLTGDEFGCTGVSVGGEDMMVGYPGFMSQHSVAGCIIYDNLTCCCIPYRHTIVQIETY